MGGGAFDRAESLERMAAVPFDVLVVGGGITGAGVALDAASRGLRTALVEQSDFASGTSSKSSKMVHGGIRYLQQHEYALVYENLHERQRLLENAPHLVSPLPFLVPLFGRGGVVSRSVAFSYRTALLTYDLTGGLRIGHRHRKVTKAEALEHFPKLDVDKLVAGFLYYDARADDARLTLALARTAALDHGAVLANYTRLEAMTTDAAGRVSGGRVAPAGGTPFEVRARVVVNATGVWADDVRALDEGTHPRSLQPAKGVHVTVPKARFPADIAAVVPVPKDRRSIFVVPWPEADLVYIGTTDTAYEGPLDDPRCTGEDVDYLLGAVNAASSAALTPADVTGVWAGLRPLLAPDGHGKTSERTADLSRRHTVRTSPNGVITVTGGKLTTYRKMAEDTVDQVVQRLDKRRRCVTKHLMLHGAPPRSQPRPRRGPLFTYLISRYGTDAGAVLALADQRPELLEPIIDGLPYIGAEVVWAVRHEMARSVEDVLARRTRAAIQDARGAAAAAGAVAALLAAEIGTDPGQAAADAERFAARARDELATAGLPERAPASEQARG